MGPSVETASDWKALTVRSKPDILAFGARERRAISAFSAGKAGAASCPSPLSLAKCRALARQGPAGLRVKRRLKEPSGFSSRGGV